MLLLSITLYALYKRRESILGTGFHAGFSAFTFPTSSTAITAILFWEDFNDDYRVGGEIIGATTILIIVVVFAKYILAGNAFMRELQEEPNFSELRAQQKIEDDLEGSRKNEM